MLFSNKSLSEFLNEYFPSNDDLDGFPLSKVIIFDQFEELFNIYPNQWQEQQITFFKNIADALKKDTLLRIVFVIREDYLAQLDPFSKILPEKLRPRFRLERLRKDAAIQAIKGPLERANYDVPINEIEQIVQDLMKIKVETITRESLEVIGEFIEPIHLQVVCQRWWEERSISKDTTKSNSNLLSKDLTNVNKALEDFYIKSLQRAIKKTNVKEDDLRRWCEENLITSSGTRSNIHLEANTTKGIPNKAIESLADSYLIRREWRSGAPWYELTHDRLIKPIKDSNKRWIDRRLKSKRSFRIKVFVPIIIISIISISLYLFTLQTNIQEELKQQRLEIKQQQQIIDLDKSLIENLRNGINYYGKKQYSQALLEFDKILSIDSNYTDALFYKGLVLDDLGKFDNALEYYDKVLVNEPKNINALYNKGLILYNQKKYDEALQYFDKVLAIEPTDVDALNGKGIILYGQQKYDEALQYYNRTLEIDPENIYALYNKGLVLYNQKKYDEALQYLDKALAIEPGYVDALNGKGKILYGQQKYDEALQYLDKALAIEPGYVDALNGKGIILYGQQKYDEALQYLDKALAIEPTDVDALNGKGIILYGQQKYDEALQYFDKVLAIEPTDVDALNGKGIVLDSLGKYQQAIEYYNKILEIDPKHVVALNNKAFALANLDKNEEALPLINNALKYDPENPHYLSTAALIMYNLEKYDEAKSYFDKALKINPNLKDTLTGKKIIAFNKLMDNNTIHY